MVGIDHLGWVELKNKQYHFLLSERAYSKGSLSAREPI